MNMRDNNPSHETRLLYCCQRNSHSSISNSSSIFHKILEISLIFLRPIRILNSRDVSLHENESCTIRNHQFLALKLSLCAAHKYSRENSVLVFDITSAAWFEENSRRFGSNEREKQFDEHPFVWIRWNYWGSFLWRHMLRYAILELVRLKFKSDSYLLSIYCNSYHEDVCLTSSALSLLLIIKNIVNEFIVMIIDLSCREWKTFEQWIANQQYVFKFCSPLDKRAFHDWFSENTHSIEKSHSSLSMSCTTSYIQCNYTIIYSAWLSEMIVQIK